MAQQIHVNGEAQVQVAFGTNPLQKLGVSIDGIDMDITDHTEPIYTDTFGPAVPFDEQHFLEDGTITCQLIFYDDAVLGQIRGRINSDGVMGQAGSLWGAGGFYFRLNVASPADGLPYNFPKVRPKDAMRQKVGTKRTVWNVTFYAIPYTGNPGPTTGSTLYNRAAT